MAEETLGTAVLALTTDDKGLDRGLDAGEKKAHGWVGRVGGMLGKGLAIGAGVAVAAGAALTAVLGDAVNAASEAQDIGAQLAAVIASTGGAAGVTTDMANDLATSLSQVTRFEDDAIVAGESLLLTFTGIGKEVFPAATESMLNMSQALGQDMKSSAVQLGKALNDPINGVTALSRVGVSFTEQQKAQIKTLQESGDLLGAQKVILAELNKEFGNSARAAGQTFAGQLDILKNALGNVKEEVGMALLPILTQLATAIGPVLMQGAQMLGGFLTGTVIPAIASVVDWFAANWPRIRETAIQVWQQIMAVVTPILTTLQGLFSSTGAAAGVIGQVWERVKALIEAVLPPIQTIVTTVLSAISGFVQQHGAEIQTTLAGAWQRIGGIISGVLQVLQAVVTPILTAIATFISTHATEIQTVMTNAWTLIKTAITTALAVIEGIIKAVLAALKGDWAGAWTAVKEMAVTVWTGITTIITTALDTLLTVLGTSLTEVKNWFVTTWQGIKDFLAGIDLADIGANIIGSMVNGIKSAAGALVDAARSVVGNAIQAAKNLLGIGSPSKVFTAFGANAGTSFANALSATAGQINMAMQGLMGPDLALSAPALAYDAGSLRGLTMPQAGGMTNHITINAAGDPLSIERATRNGVLSAARARGLR